MFCLAPSFSTLLYSLQVGFNQNASGIELLPFSVLQVFPPPPNCFGSATTAAVISLLLSNV